MKTFQKLAVAALATLLTASCQKDEQGTARLAIVLTDAPATYDEVNVEVTGIDIHTTDFGWTAVDLPDSVYNLLTLQDSANAVLDTIVLAAGKVSQIRLILGSQNTVVVSGTSFPLLLSSQDESGLKLNVHQDIVANQAYTLKLDFDANQSIVLEGNSNYRLKPVLTAQFY